MNISISLPPELVALIKNKVDSGRYSSTSEVVREALRLLERADQQEAERLKGLRRFATRRSRDPYEQARDTSPEAKL